jgi:hypothetical protein
MRDMRPRRQGDILLVPVKKLPDGLAEVPREDGKIVLAEGEATGHLHMIEAPEAAFLAKDLADLEGRFLAIEEEVALTHPEHDTVTLEPGNYEVRRQREYSDVGGITFVAD